MSSKSKQKGTAMESLVKDYFNSFGLDADRLTLHGKNDVGDIRVTGIDAVFEVKNCVKLELSKWIEETVKERDNAKKRWGFTVFKRKGKGAPGQQFVLMELEQLIDIFRATNPEAFR